MELAFDNLVNNSNCPHPLSTAERIGLLIERRQRWRRLDWTQRVTVPLRGPCQAYELVGGVFAKSMRGSGDEEVWPPGSRHFLATWLPTKHGKLESVGTDLKKAEKEDLGVPTRDFAIDPTQDVLVLVEVDVRYVYVYSDSTQ